MSSKKKEIKYMTRRVGTCFYREIELSQKILILTRFVRIKKTNVECHLK